MQISLLAITSALIRSTISWLDGKKHTEKEWVLKTKIVQYCLADMKAMSEESATKVRSALGSETEHVTIAVSLLEQTVRAMKTRDRGAALEASKGVLQHGHWRDAQ